MTIAFWASLVLVLYVYLGYPIFIAAWARMRPRPIARDERRPLPGVSVVIAARDEAGRIGARIDNLLSLDYPRDRLQLIVVSDGSTDRTLDVLARYSEAVQVVALPRCGKAAALNAGVAAARHDVVAFADARQRFAPDALRMLVRNFADERLGAVSGELLLSSPVSTGEHTVGEGLGLYWRYEKWIRRNESLAGSTVGATGAIYAMRKSLWQELPAGTLLDDVLAPMRAVLRGKRVVFEPAAKAFDFTEEDPQTETRRRTRTLAGNYQMLGLEPALLVPWRNPVWFQLVSHKLGRLLVPYALASLLASSAWLAGQSWLYATAFAGQLVFYGLAAYGAALAHRPIRRHPAGPVPARFRAGAAKPGHDGVVNA